MNTCRRSVGKTWCPKPSMVQWTYSMIVRLTLYNGSVVWWPEVDQATVKMKLGRIQLQVFLGITCVMRTTPTLVLAAILNIFIKGVARMISYML